MIRSHIASILISTSIALSFNAPAMAQSPSAGLSTGVINAAVPLTSDELKALQLMREEEKLARDVYQALFDKWNLVVFQNIMASEQVHFTAIGTLLTRYGAPDPALAGAGVYTDPALNTLYNQLLGKGLQSAQDALQVGLLIEKQDISDLENALKATTKLDIKRVLNNIMNGSYNHLDAFETVCAVTVAIN
jgi:hypothetical protein